MNFKLVSIDKMKTLFVLPAAFFFFVFCVSAQTASSGGATQPQSAEELELAKLSKEMVQTYNVRNYAEALRSGLEVLSLSSKLYGEDSPQVASVHLNLGVVYKADKQYGKASEQFQSSLAIYQKNNPVDERKLLSIYNELGVLCYESRKFSEAEEWFLNARRLSVKIYGQESKETIALAESLAIIYREKNESEKAESYLWMVKEDGRKVFGAESPEFERYNDNYTCFTLSEASNKLADVLDRRKTEAASLVDPRKIINGYATYLAKPRYPREAAGKGGRVVVKIRIDEAGKVLDARAFCGPNILREGSEKAALESKFAPTLLKGIAVKVTGLIVYNYQ